MLDETHEPLLVYRARGDAPVGIAFRSVNSVGVQNKCLSRLDGWPMRPYRRFGPALTDKPARLGFDAVSYSFIVVDFHHLLPAGLPAHLTVHFCTVPGRSPRVGVAKPLAKGV